MWHADNSKKPWTKRSTFSQEKPWEAGNNFVTIEKSKSSFVSFLIQRGIKEFYWTTKTLFLNAAVSRIRETTWSDPLEFMYKMSALTYQNKSTVPNTTNIQQSTDAKLKMGLSWSFLTELQPLMSFTTQISFWRNHCVASFAPGCCWLMLSHLRSIQQQRYAWQCQHLSSGHGD